MLYERMNQCVPLRIVLRGGNILLVPERMNRGLRSQLVRHETDLDKWPHSPGQQPVVDLIHISKVENGVTALVFVIHAHFIVEDGMKAHIPHAYVIVHIFQIVEVIRAQRKNGSPRPEHLIPEMRKCVRVRMRVNRDLYRRRLTCRVDCGQKKREHQREKSKTHEAHGMSSGKTADA